MTNETTPSAEICPYNINPYSVRRHQLGDERKTKARQSLRESFSPFPRLFYKYHVRYHDPPNAHAMWTTCMYVPGMYFPSVPSFPRSLVRLRTT
jgi:hypothetical protein